MNIRSLEKEDWIEVSRIYKQGIETKIATFETKIPEWAEWDKSHLNTCRFVAQINDKIVGWVAISPVSGRCVYGGVAEVSIYVDSFYSGKQIGTKLLKKLIEESEKNGIWTLQAGIFSENIGSLKLHKKVGFRKIGYRERISKLEGFWKDIVLLEKRSKKVGV